MILAGKRILITGVMTKDSIAFAAAARAQRAGAEVILTSYGRVRRITERAAKRLPEHAAVLELDVNRPEDFEALALELRERWGGVDGALHAIAFAPLGALGGNFMHTSAADACAAFQTSAFSYKALAAALEPLMVEAGGGSVVALDFDATVAWPLYDWMGVSKAALESVNRYLARDLGPRGIRANLVAAGPLATVASEGIPGFSALAGAWHTQAPLGWNVEDAGPVADAVCVLLSDLSRGISGEILHVDGGFHAMGTVPVGDEVQAELLALAGAT
ncbi:MAG TPA: enoyl-ACP reductase FabI [Thermoleophilaceae bacterium]|jgi:enoyl-[acyl-carrier protein] reductase I